MPVAAKPFLKWAGGKTGLLPKIETYFPFDGKRITKYAEPFVGSGAVLFHILNNYTINEIYISDINIDLIDTYITIRDDVKELLFLLKEYEIQYVKLDDIARKDYFLDKRNRFNELKQIKFDSYVVEKSALMIFLNKTCFNGLYRVNSKGLYNVPVGRYKNPTICDSENLKIVSDKLSNVFIKCAEYYESEEFIDNRTFVYFDPPYRPLTKTAGFTLYTKKGFDDKKQIELSRFYDKMCKKGAICLLSNSDPKNTNVDDNFFDELYSDYSIKRVYASRMINSNASRRGKISEILVSNNV